MNGSENTWQEYKRKRNSIVNKIRTEKEKFYAETIDLNRSNPRELWKNLKSLLPGKKQVLPDEIRFEREIINEEADIADRFNKYFLYSIDNIIMNIRRPQNVMPFNAGTTVHNGTFNNFEKLTMLKMKQIVKHLKNIGGGESGISKHVLCDVVYAVGNRLLDVINTSLSDGVCP